MSVGSTVMAPLSRWLITSYDWRTAMWVIGDLVWLVVIPAALLVRNAAGGPRPPRAARAAAAPGLTIGQVGPHARSSPRSPSPTSRAARPTPGPIFHMVTHAIDRGVPAMAAATVLSAAGLASLTGKIGCGIFADRIGAKRTLVAGLAAAGRRDQPLPRSPEGLASFYALAVVFGFAYGGVMPLYAIVVREYFGERIMGSAFGAVSLAATLGMALGPWLGGWAYDAVGQLRVDVHRLLRASVSGRWPSRSRSGPRTWSGPRCRVRARPADRALGGPTRRSAGLAPPRGWSILTRCRRSDVSCRIWIRYRLRYLGGAACLLLATAFSLSIPWTVKSAVDALERDGAAARIGPYVLLILGLAVAHGVARLGSRFAMLGAGQWVEHDIRAAPLRAAPVAAPRLLPRHRTGDLMSRASNDISTLRALAGLRHRDAGRHHARLRGHARPPCGPSTRGSPCSRWRRSPRW